MAAEPFPLAGLPNSCVRLARSLTGKRFECLQKMQAVESFARPQRRLRQFPYMPQQAALITKAGAYHVSGFSLL